MPHAALHFGTGAEKHDLTRASTPSAMIFHPVHFAPSQIRRVRSRKSVPLPVIKKAITAHMIALTMTSVFGR
jgi:hypothetical protein